MPRGRVVVLALAVALMGAGAAAGRIGAATPTLVTYPSSATIPAKGKLPAGGGTSVSLNEPIGGDDSALMVVSNAEQVVASIDAGKLAPLDVHVGYPQFVRFGSALIPDAVTPWDGGPRPTEEPNQPLTIEVSVPYGTRPGVYKSTVTVTADTTNLVVPLTITVYNVTLPKPGDVKGNLLSVFGVGPQGYADRAFQTYNFRTDDQTVNAYFSLFSFLSAARISPDSWGYGIPHDTSGYQPSNAWWKDSAGDMIRQLTVGRFPDLWIPLSSNRASKGSYIAGLSPFEPEKWCAYLRNVKTFWTQHGWLGQGQIPYAYPYDEPGTSHTSLLARQATSLHRCFPGAKLLVTATPDPSMSRLYDGKGTDDVDIWAAVDWRYYGVFTSPGNQKNGLREHRYLEQIDKARSHGKKIFAYTYYGVPGFPSFSVLEPLSNPRMFVLWAALEGIDGILYGQGLTTYKKPGDPRNTANDSRGEGLLIYPGNVAPIPSARIEQIRSGIVDWDLFAMVRKRFGAAKVRTILGSNGLFSADAKGVKLACTIGCDLKANPPQAWPQWSHDASTPGRIEAARRDALKLLSG